jgi:hypothetical protein
MNAKKIIWALALLVIGVAIGRYLLPRPAQPQNSQNANVCSLNGQTNIDKEKLKLKIDLLQEYAVFTALPKEKFSDPIQYADDMKNKIKAINEDALTAQFNATADPAKSDDQRATQIVSFLNFLATEIKNDLQ